MVVRRDAPQPLAFYRTAPLAPSPAATSPGRDLRPSGGAPRKPFTRRQGDSSQRVRQFTQLVFGAVAVLVGIQFYLWVRYYETAGRTLRVSRPAGVEAWLPIAALMNLKDLLLTRTVPEVHPAGMFMLVAFLAISWMYRKSFCSWICPIGTLSEWLWKGGEATFGRTFTLPRCLDVPLRALKYVLFGLFMYVVVTMPVDDIREFLSSPYGLVADVKMLDFFRRMGRTTAIVVALLVILSVFVKNVWCRYLCPYGAVTGLLALAGPTRIRRNPASCIDCGKCAAACPAVLPVDTANSIRSAECTACMSCVGVCPAAGALSLTTGPRHWNVIVEPWTLAAAIGIIFIGIVGYARVAGYWHTNLPEALLFDLIPRAAEFAHPR
jgi:polyferredoxin